MAAGGGEYIPSALRETLDSIVSPEVREHIIKAALQSAAMLEVPAHPRRFREFLEGPLRESLLYSLGVELGGSVISELARLALMAERDLVARTGAPSAYGSSTPPSRPPARGAIASQAARGYGSSRPASSRPGSTLPSSGYTPPPARSAPPARPPKPAPEYELDEPDSNPLQQFGLRRTDPYAPQARQQTGPSKSKVRDDRNATTEPAPDSRAEAPPPSSANYPLGTANALGVIGTASVEFGTARRNPLVLVASTNPDLVRCFVAWLDPRASVQRVRSVLSMSQDLADTGERRIVIVLDARSPSIRPLSLAAIADELPAGTSVVLWGIGSDVYAKMLQVSNAVAKWMVCSTDSSTSEVVAQCARIVS